MATVRARTGRPAEHPPILVVTAAISLTLLSSGGCGGTEMVELEGGLRVIDGVDNAPGRERLDGWVDSLFDFWQPRVDRAAIAAAVSSHVVRFVDEQRIDLGGRAVRGYTWQNESVIGMRWRDDEQVDWDYVHSLFMHELGHAVLSASGAEHDEAVHHAIFQREGYGY